MRFGSVLVIALISVSFHYLVGLALLFDQRHRQVEEWQELVTRRHILCNNAILQPKVECSAKKYVYVVCVHATTQANSSVYIFNYGVHGVSQSFESS